MRKSLLDLFPAIPRYGLALMANAAAFLLTRWFVPRFQYNSFDLFQAAVVISSYFGGLESGLLAAVISIFVLDYFFIPPLYTLRLGFTDVFRLSVFAVVAILTSSLSARFKEARRELERSHDRVERRTRETSVESRLTALKTDFVSVALRYGFSLLAVALAFLFTFWTMPIIKNNAFDFFIGAVAITSYYGGLGPALLTALLAIPTLSYYFMPPYNAFSFSAADILRLMVFMTVAVVSSSLSARLKRAKSELQKARDELEMRVIERTKQLTLANTHLSSEMSQRQEAEKEILQISQREQRRLGEDLHDGLCQTLFGLRLLAQDVRDAALADSLAWTSDMDQISTRLAEALSQADVVAHGLYPVELETNGLASALTELAKKLSTIYHVRCRYRSTGSIATIDSVTANHLYRIAQEAVMNAIKRGKSKRISIRLRQRDSRVFLSVTDDGSGFQIHIQRKGMGLKMMQYRARMIDAAFHIRSRSKGCTRVLCTFTPNDYKEISHESKTRQSEG